MSDLKRMFDVLAASIILVAGAPILALASAAIKLESRGPILFTQTRVGRHRQPIQTIKLRTMVADAERRGPKITAGSDTRITRVGRWLRKMKVDELPQLWNVIRGEMSLVGPRPEVPLYANSYRPEWERLFSVRPGLTDVASLTFRDEEVLLEAALDRERAYTEVIMPLKLAMALDGIERHSLRADFDLVVRTAVAVLRGRGTLDHTILVEARRQIAELNRKMSAV